MSLFLPIEVILKLRILYQYHFHFSQLGRSVFSQRWGGGRGVILMQTNQLGQISPIQTQHNKSDLMFYFQTAFSKAIIYSSLFLLVLNYSGFQRILKRILYITPPLLIAVNTNRKQTYISFTSSSLLYTFWSLWRWLWSTNGIRMA